VGQLASVHEVSTSDYSHIPQAVRRESAGRIAGLFEWRAQWPSLVGGCVLGLLSRDRVEQGVNGGRRHHDSSSESKRWDDSPTHALVGAGRGGACRARSCEFAPTHAGPIRERDLRSPGRLWLNQLVRRELGRRTHTSTHRMPPPLQCDPALHRGPYVTRSTPARRSAVGCAGLSFRAGWRCAVRGVRRRR
jgi:hypothetical protein